ncbi:PH domain-containing protein [Polyangium spumosum]|uniref:Bacterial Pleckstrin homology domain-containing protein n=1 Tax=Polyangium spumosum TaxID=889282 RepID=A0A6N7PYC3_9BACT|nr:PH domain-containing protein [Polyangium spumosum]MRG97078.1 hypothetical protein [Polyangium spumosum]
MRTEIRRSTWVKPLLSVFGGTAERSYVDIEGDEIHIRFGWLFDERIPLSRVTSVERARWPLLGGLGWRTNFVDTVAVVGSYDDVVKIRLSPSLPLRVLLRVPAETVYVSVQDPDAFVAEVRRKIASRAS